MELDEDVKTEQNKLKAFCDDENGTNFDLTQCSDPIIIAGLRKIYNTGSIFETIKKCGKTNEEKCVTAVKDLWYSVPRGQIFGFLGVNGAGKTSTLSMLCGKFGAGQGSAFINQIPISNQIACRRMIGYCPQFDAIFDLLTAKEHLNVYGMIKGLPKQQVEKQSKTLMKGLTLLPYKNKRAGTYSGGNKRKLSVAMAMIGEPPIVFLDVKYFLQIEYQKQMFSFSGTINRNGSSIKTSHVGFYKSNNEWSISYFDNTFNGRM